MYVQKFIHKATGILVVLAMLLGMVPITMVMAATAPILESVSPAEGAVLLGADDNFVLTVDAADDNLYELEVDHSLWATIPEFSVYASEADPYGGDAALFADAGVTVDYNAADQVWTIDFGADVTQLFIDNGITFYLVLIDQDGLSWGSMDPTTPENTFAYTLSRDLDQPTLESVSPAEGAVVLGADDSFVLTVDAADASDNLYELEIDHTMEATLYEFSVYASETDPYGGDGALFADAGVTVDYDAADQKWTIDFGAGVTDAFVANGGITFYLVLHDTAGNTWGTMYGTTPDNTFAYTLQEAAAGDTIELSGSLAGNYSINTPGLTILLKDGTVVTGGSPCFTVNASNTLVTSESIGGAVCLPSGGADGIVVADGLTNIIIEGLEIDGADGRHGIFFEGAITDVILRDNFIHDMAAGDGIYFTAQPAELTAGANAIQGNYFLDNFGVGVNNPAGTGVDATYNAWGDIAGPTAGDGVGANVSADPWTYVDLFMASSGTAVADVVVLGDEITYTVYGNLENMTGADFTFTYPAALDYISHALQAEVPFNFFYDVKVDETARTINVVGVSTTELDGVVPLFDVTFEGLTTGTDLPLSFTDGQFTMAPGYGPSTNIYPTALVGIDNLEVSDGLAVTDADLFYGKDPLVIDQPLDGNFTDGFLMFLDPTVDYYYLDTNTITSNNPLADGMYPFYLSPDTTTPIFYVKVEGSTFTLIDGYQYDVEGLENPLRINGDFTPGTYTYVGDLTDIYDSSDTVSIEITFIDALAWLQMNTVLSSVSGTIADLTATFPDAIPPVIVAEDYVIDSRMTLAEALPAGSTVTVFKDGVEVLTDITLSGTGPFWFTELFDPDADRAAFDANYGGKVEEYEIIVTGPGTNPLDFDTTVFIESVISKDGYVTETVLDDITLDVNISADEDAALAWLQENTFLTSVSMTIDDLKATFPDSIPPVIVDADYVIDSRMTLAEALPAGSTVTVFKDGLEVLTDITLSGTGPFWFTELFDPDADRADFDANYGGKVEEYEIVVTGPGGNPLAFDTTVFIESVISKDGYVTETVLDDITLDVNISADEDAALAWLQENTFLTSVSMTIDDLKATFPDSIPPVIVDADYVIDSRITLTQALPAGATVTVYKDGTPVLTDITLSGTGPFWFTQLFDPDQPRADFDANYGGKVEDYIFEVTFDDGTTLAYDSAVTIESVISKDSYTTETVLDEITLAMRDLSVTDADLFYGIDPGTINTALGGNFTDGFYMALDPAEDWYYLDTNMITSNNPLADGMYPFYLSPDTTTPIFYIKVEGSTYTLIDGYQYDVESLENPLRINGDFLSGTYTYTGELTDIYGTSTAVSIDITFVTLYDVQATVRMQGRTVSSGVDMTLTTVGTPEFGPYTETSVDLISFNLSFGKLEGVTYRVTTNQARYLDIPASLDIQFLLDQDYEISELVLKAGDANEDQVIDTGDAAIVGTQYGTGTLADNGDVNFDGRVNIQDLALVGGNYLLTSEVAYGSWTP